ncbi:DNA polymerase III subunit epsilon [Marchantia polymorpha subsp. ruderalis]|uniref:DNA mismatch repair proteins mutS family domain-containing protein n=2 Tax=Marchantia polymorpha TaxID=3197 RepID=A0A176VNI0_MARPO|nr:hypothetical protein AXG93_3348s1080 [Marchantia polymorpha subsp. ruderalis]PTQ28483.1 hypothetical protein MARPO_0162s0013 [Marchantia polymorpha]PTQ28484.1 hypothetical protein MARPO_0162s0013 [Marchantia polymorpha]PTQ28485.1 hypothetical protein MARPO_0162s0013 [Marchantia polymorpha]BBN06992.1 hypothetical protein Mp_4g00080 [Marchantia polymorpha subsp. ruderalis]|eukprot:PTQ28483.1 hypothetical protein MARPO_0162s0013 [Marchantia polymorpha]
MTLKWPASNVLATSLSMVGAGKSPSLGIGVGGGEMGFQTTGIWRGLRQIGSAQKAFGGRGKIVGMGKGARSIAIAESAGTCRRKNRASVSPLDFEAGRLTFPVEIKKIPGPSCAVGTLSARGFESGPPKSCDRLLDRIVWSSKMHSRCPQFACTFKDPTFYSRGGRKITSFSGSPVTFISSQKLSGSLPCVRDSRSPALASSSSYCQPCKSNFRPSSPVYNAASGQRRLSYFKSENLRWRRIFKVFSEDVDSREAVANDQERDSSVNMVAEGMTGKTEDFEDIGGQGLDGLAESTARGSVENTDSQSKRVEVSFEAGTALDNVHKGPGNPVSDNLTPSDVTVICFDIETTGLHPAYHRIIEFAARDLSGGEYSTIETLVNPDREVPLESERIHKISSKMVNKPDVPRWKDVALAIVSFVESRRKGQGSVILVAHNGKRFDVPFIMKEFRDCDVPIPSYWRFADSMPLARSAMKSLGQKRPKVALMDLFNFYNLQSVGDAHRAMADVNMLAPVLQMVMNDLSMGVLELLEQSFSVEDLSEKGKALPMNRVPAIEEMYDGVEVDVPETGVSSEVLGTLNLDAASQSYEAALGIETGREVGEILRVSVPWDSSDKPNLQTEDEFEKSLGLSLGEGQKLNLGQPIYELEEESSKHVPKETISQYEEYLREKEDDRLPSDRDISSTPISYAALTGFVPADLGEPQVTPEGKNIRGRSSDLGEEICKEEMSSSLIKGEKSLQEVGRDVRGDDREKEVDVFVEENIDVLRKQLSELQVESNGSAWDSDETPVVNARNLLEEDEAPLLTSTVDVSLLSPMMKQYVETKRQRDPKFLLLSQVGDFYEAFFEDANRLAEACNIRLTAKEGGKLLKRKIPMAGVPVQHIDKNLHTLLAKGIPVVRQEQVGEEESGLSIERQVTAVLTPGTLVDCAMLEESYNNFLVAVMPPSVESGTWGLAFSDISTGEFQATELQGKEAFVQELLRLQPAEILFPVGRLQEIDVDSPTPMGLPSQFCYSSRPQSDFSKAEAEKKLKSNYAAVSLESMGISGFPHAVRAAGGLLGYVEETQQMTSEDIPLQKLKYFSATDSMHLSETVRKHLELTSTSRWGKAEGSFIWAVDETRTAMGRRMLQKWLLWPLLQHKKIIERQDAVEIFVKNSEARKALRKELELLGDLERLTGRVGWKRANARDMLTVAQSLQALPKLSRIVEELSSNSYITAVLRIPIAAIEMADRVQGMLVEESDARSSGDLIKIGVDVALDELRKEVGRVHDSIAHYEQQEQQRTGISSLEVGYTKPHGRFISIRKTRMKDLILPKDYQNIQSLKTEERFTTPILLEYEKLRVETLKKAAEREDQLFMMIKDEMAGLLKPVQEYSKSLAEIDVLCNFAEIAVNWNYCRPRIFETGREVTILKGRHPVVERCLPEGINFVANSTYLGYPQEKKVNDIPGSSPFEVTQLFSELQEGGKVANVPSRLVSEEESAEFAHEDHEHSWPRPDVMILTGPNASGKSCYLRQIGLIQILAQAGSFVPARECRLSISDGLYTRVGSVDDLAAGQSTFKVEMSESAAILEKATPRSLVLLDEVGRGTGSQEGEMIARAIIEYLAQQVKARTVFSTHYHELHDLDLELPNVSNYHLEAVETSSGDIIFDHTVRPGFALRSYAVGVARASGMPEWICNRASELLAELAMPEGAEDKTGGSKSRHAERELFDELLEKQPMERRFEDENQSGVLVGSTGGMRNNIRIGKSSDSWFEVIKFSKRGKSKRARVRTDSETGEVDVSYIEESDNPALFDSTGVQEEEAEYDEKEVHHAASSWKEETSFDFDATAEVTADLSNVETGKLAEDLSEVWNRVCATLQNRPATQALTKQKGILISVTRSADAISVKMGASALFVKKFQQHEHASALEAAFTAVLKQPVQLEVSILDTKH